jgi:hypothetical protein
MFPKFTLAETYLQIWRYTIFLSEYQCKQSKNTKSSQS